MTSKLLKFQWTYSPIVERHGITIDIIITIIALVLIIVIVISKIIIMPAIYLAPYP